MRPEVPGALQDMSPAVAEETRISNYIAELKDQGILQHRLPRDKANQNVTSVVISPAAFYEGVKRTIKDSLTRLHMLKLTAPNVCFNSRVDEISGTLASGCCVVAYVKLRAIILTDMPSHHTENALRMPRDSYDLPIPTAFAFAVQQLGILNVLDLDHSLSLAPCFPETGHKYGIPSPTFIFDDAGQPVNSISLPNDGNCALASCLDSTFKSNGTVTLLVHYIYAYPFGSSKCLLLGPYGRIITRI